jgi:hypothetical protein
VLVLDADHQRIDASWRSTTGAPTPAGSVRCSSRALKRLQPNRPERDIFPTAYKMNSRKALAALLDRDFDWTLTFRTGLEQYVLPWPRLASSVAAVEPRLPRAMHTVLIVSARKKY